MKFELEEIPALLADGEVTRLAVAAMAAIRDSSSAPLAVAIRASGQDDAVRKAGFAASVQGIAALLARLPDLESLPEELVVHLQHEGEQTAARGRKIVERARAALHALEEAGAPAVPLKGAALLLRGDVDPGLRAMGDIDLLVIDPSKLETASRTLQKALRYESLLSTPRHLVLRETNERVVAPACEHPDNPIRIEVHPTFRLPVFGTFLDATDDLVRLAEWRDGVRVPPSAVMFRHQWHHAANDFSGSGIRGAGAMDFVRMAQRGGPLRAIVDPRDRQGTIPLVYAADAIERLFPGTFDAASLETLGATVPPMLRERARALPVLRHSRPPRNWTMSALGLAPGPFAKSRLLLRTAFPSPGEVKANFAPEASGLTLAAAYARVFVRRAIQFMR